MDAFSSTWSAGHQTFGDGQPEGGEQFDDSVTFRQLKGDTAAAAPGSRWTGTASSAYGKANTDHGRVLSHMADLDRRLAAEIDRSARVVTDGRRSLDAVRAWVTDAAATVPQNATGERMLLPIVRKGIGQVADILQNSNNQLNAIGESIRGLSGDYRTLSNQKFAGFKQSPQADEPEKKGDHQKPPGEAGKADSEALQNGELTPEQRERLVAATTLTPAQQTALRNGQLTLPPEQMSYLQSFSRAFGDKTPAEIKAIMERAGADGGRVADVFQLASNPHVTTGLPPTQPPSVNNPSSGGKYALPDGIQKVLDGPALTQPFTDGVFSDGRYVVPPEPTGPLQPTPGLNDLADIIQHGNRDLQAGTDLDSGLFNKSQEMLNQANQTPIAQAPGPGSDPQADGPRWYHENVDPTLQNMFNAVNKDDIVIHDAITGSGGEKFLNNLTTHQWQDDGLAAGGLTDWVTDTAATDPTGRAAETAHALAEYTSKHSDQLLNLPGTQSQSLGEVNPELTRDWARAFSPYMDDMVGLNTGDSKGVFAPLDPHGDHSEPVNTRKLMSVLFSDHPPLGEAPKPDSPATASQIAMASVQSHMNQYFDAAAHSVTDNEPGEKYFGMNCAGRLQAAMDLGAYDERFDVTHDAAEAKKQSYDIRSNLYEASVKLAEQLPVVGLPVGVGGEFTKELIIGPDPVAPHVDSVGGRDSFPVKVHMAATLLADGAGDPALRQALQQFIRDGQLQPSAKSEFAAFYNAVNSYLPTTGHDAVVNSMIQDYWNAYTSAITNAEPPEYP